MHARVVRFTDVTPEQIEAVMARVKESGGPPEGVPSTGLKLLYDKDQGTAVFIGMFANEDDLKKGSEILDKMDTGDTPGTRASVDLCEVKIEEDA